MYFASFRILLFFSCNSFPILARISKHKQQTRKHKIVYEIHLYNIVEATVKYMENTQTTPETHQMTGKEGEKKTHLTMNDHV